MLSEDQIRLRLEEIAQLDDRTGGLLRLMHEVLPELVAAVSHLQRTSSQKSDDAGARYGGGVPGRMWTQRRDCPDCYKTLRCERHGGSDQARAYHPMTCPSCTPEQPCERAKALEGKA